MEGDLKHSAKGQWKRRARMGAKGVSPAGNSLQPVQGTGSLKLDRIYMPEDSTLLIDKQGVKKMREANEHTGLILSEV